MGFLVVGKPLNWDESKEVRKYVHEHGVKQFINIWLKNKNREDMVFLWGDEVEGFVALLSPEGGKKSVKLNLRGSEILKELETHTIEAHNKAEGKKGCATCPPSVIFHPEYGRFMIETTPSDPYGGYTRDIRCVEANMRLRRVIIRRHLKEGEIYSTLTTYPLLGDGDFTVPSYKPKGPVAISDYVPDELINPHPRFATLTANIRTRRGSKVDIRVPMFKDKNTPKEEKEIHMDAMAFGMGCCCLQVTFLARNLTEARNLYDHLAVLGPIFLSLTAATPFYRGRMADIDVRWTVISQSVDDRTPVERGLDPQQREKAILKSRYDSISCFISNDGYMKPSYNDVKIKHDEKTFKTLLDAGVDGALAKHIAHLWIRDPLVIYKNRVELDDKKEVDHFENIQSTNWQSVRFKPPPSDKIGWRVEFRTMEVQITDFENAAFTVFIALLSRAILAFGLNLYIPISKVDQNMKTAHFRDSVRANKFHWRRDVGSTVMEQMRTTSENKAAAKRQAEEKMKGKVNGTMNGEGHASGYMKSVIEVAEKDYTEETLGDFKKVEADQRFVLVYGEIEKDGRSWCPGCNRALPIIEAKIKSFTTSAALLKLPVSRQHFCGNEKHFARKDFEINCIPTLIRIGPRGMLEEPLGGNWCTDAFCVNQYMAQKPPKKLRGRSTHNIHRDSDDDTQVEISMEQIMLGDGKEGPLGLIHIVHAYLDMIECDDKTRKVVNNYLKLIADRASGKLMTAATWIRNFVDLHPEYKHDSRLSESIVHDLLKTTDGITNGTICVPQLLGKYANVGAVNLTDRDGEVVAVKGPKKKICLTLAKKEGKIVYASC